MEIQYKRVNIPLSDKIIRELIKRTRENERLRENTKGSKLVSIRFLGNSKGSDYPTHGILEYEWLKPEKRYLTIHFDMRVVKGKLYLK